MTALLGLGVACTPQVTPSPAVTTSKPGIQIVSPDGPIAFGEEIRIIAEIRDADKPLADQEVTFDVVEGEGSYPGGFETDTTDETGVATSLGLQAKAPGTITVRIATASQSTEVDIEITDAGE
ncbi:hypothetical protein [Microbacterium sp. 69-10]|uniref:hypothetical protein n=1 Tax=Microbacterium sp. 69-10 TaxID=1895783 RepID=UPI0025E9AEE0|nr:hypothetical protein [Microbacterium sp. 69-10]